MKAYSTNKWLRVALGLLEAHIATPYREYSTFTSDEIGATLRLEAPNHNYIGLLITLAIRKKLIVRCGSKKSTRKQAKGRYIGVYRPHARFFTYNKA